MALRRVHRCNQSLRRLAIRRLSAKTARCRTASSTAVRARTTAVWLNGSISKDAAGALARTLGRAPTRMNFARIHAGSAATDRRLSTRPIIKGRTVTRGSRVASQFGGLVRRSLSVAVALLWVLSSNAHDIDVKYRPDPVDVDNGHFQHMSLKPSSLVQDIYYDAGNHYLLVSLNGTFYHYCGIPANVVAAWIDAPSLGSFYNSSVKGRFDCRVNPVPAYKH